MSEPYPIKILRTSQSVDLLIVWSIHNLCNHNCSYCPDYNSNGSETWNSLEKAKEVIDKLYDHYVLGLGIQRALISFSGGEPLLFRGFPELIHYIREKGMYVGLTSNGTGNLKLWQKFYHLLEFISISYHPEFVNDEQLLEFLNSAYLNPDVVIPSVRLMTPSNEKLYAKSINFLDKLKEIPNYSYEFVKIQNDFGEGIEESHYSKDQNEFLNNQNYTEITNDKEKCKFSKIFLDHDVFYDNNQKEKLRPNDLVNKGQFNFKGWKCNAGTETIFIDYDGSTFAAGCRINGTLGNLQDIKSMKFPSEAITCVFDRCICQSDIMISKYNPKFQEP